MDTIRDGSVWKHKLGHLALVIKADVDNDAIHIADATEEKVALAISVWKVADFVIDFTYVMHPSDLQQYPDNVYLIQSDWNDYDEQYTRIEAVYDDKDVAVEHMHKAHLNCNGRLGYNSFSVLELKLYSTLESGYKPAVVVDDYENTIDSIGSGDQVPDDSPIRPPLTSLTQDELEEVWCKPNGQRGYTKFDLEAEFARRREALNE